MRGRRSEPILVPKLRIRFADFPYSHCSIGQRLLTSETCCGRGYDRRHEPVLRVADGFSRVVEGAPDAAPMAALCRALGPLAG